VGADNSGNPLNYKYVDGSAVPGESYYYYLEDVDITGKRSQSPIVALDRVHFKGKVILTWAAIKKMTL